MTRNNIFIYCHLCKCIELIYFGLFFGNHYWQNVKLTAWQYWSKGKWLAIKFLSIVTCNFIEFIYFGLYQRWKNFNITAWECWYEVHFSDPRRPRGTRLEQTNVSVHPSLTAPAGYELDGSGYGLTLNNSRSTRAISSSCRLLPVESNRSIEKR